jgi:RNA polymerase sigma-70 factor, ECF subfamily
MLMQFAAFDAAYVDRLRAGDAATQKHFVAYFSRLIQIKSGTRLQSAAAVEDVRQETFARVLLALNKTNGIRCPERLGAFVNAVCNNVLRECLRGASRQEPIADADAISDEDSSRSAVDRLARAEESSMVHRILDELGERDRRLIRAVFLEERDKNEVCREFGVDRNYLRVLLCRAKQAFKSLYLKGQKTQSRCRGLRTETRPPRTSRLNLEGPKTVPLKVVA